jgi:hypothetical protein
MTYELLSLERPQVDYRISLFKEITEEFSIKWELAKPLTGLT